MIRAPGRTTRVAFALLPLGIASAQAPERPKQPPPIADNSFLVEEAYNQEPGVVQHIGVFRRAPDGSWNFAFTQEWPAPSQRHQLSYTAPVVYSRPDGTGLGDVVLNYRYQAVGHDDARIWMAPRLSLTLPTGDPSRGRGLGGPGVQTNLPLSVELTPTLVTHWNLGGTATRARDVTGVRRTLRTLAAAASAIWLVAPTFNFMLETTWERAESFDVGDVVRTDGQFTVLPGVRGAINLSSGMQIVPGFGVPFVRSGGRTEHDLLLYLSIEHSFR